MSARTTALDKLNSSAGRIHRNILELALAANIDPDDLNDELSDARTPLTSQNYIDLRTKLLAWVDREIAQLNSLKNKINNINLP